MPTVAHYQQAKNELEALVRPLSADALTQTCHACPAWSVQDVVAHHIHVVITHLSGGLPSSAFTAILDGDDHTRTIAAKERDDWAQAGVEERRGRSLHELLAEWNDAVAGMDDRGAGAGLDLVMHLDDIGETLGRPTPYGCTMRGAVLTAWYHVFVKPRLAGIGAKVDLLATDTNQRWGCEAAPTVAGSSYELLRTMGSRRARVQADALLDWGHTPEPTRQMLPAYGWPEVS